MKRKILMIISIVVTLFTLASCFSLQDVKTLSINYTLKDKYIVNEEVLLDDIQVIAIMTDDTQKNLTFSSNLVSKISGHRLVSDSFYLDTRQVGKFTLKISYEGVVFEVDYEVTNTNTWDGSSYSTPAIDSNDANTYLITSAPELAWVKQQSELINAGQGGVDLTGKTLKIQANIDLGDKWSAIPYLENVTFTGSIPDVTDGKYTITLRSGSSFIKDATQLEMYNIKFHYEIDQSSFAGIVSRFWAKSSFTTQVESKFVNVETSGTVFVTSYGSAFVGWGSYYGTGDKDTRNEKVEFINCKNSVNLTTLGSNSGLYVGYMETYSNTVFYFDSASISSNNLTGTFTGLDRLL